MSEATEEPFAPIEGAKEPLWKRLLPIIFSLLLVVFIFGWVLPQFIDYDAVFRAIGEISVGEWLILLMVAAIRVVPEGWVYQASLPGLTWKQGASQFVVTQAINNVPPGGLDLIARFQMARSWGRSASAATTATIGSWFFVSFPKLLLPVIALLLLAMRRIQDDGIDFLAVIGLLAVGVLTLLVVLMMRSERFALWLGRTLGRLANFTVGLFRKKLSLDFEEQALEFRDETLGLVRKQWKQGFSAGIAAQIALFLVLLLSVYFVGLDNVDWVVVFAVFAVVAIVSTIPILNAPGIAEAVYIAILSTAVGEGSSDEVAAAVFVFRLLTWLLPIPIGGIVFSRWRTWARENSVGNATSSIDQAPG